MLQFCKTMLMDLYKHPVIKSLLKSADIRVYFINIREARHS